jgi:hypothetical protein
MLAMPFKEETYDITISTGDASSLVPPDLGDEDGADCGLPFRRPAVLTTTVKQIYLLRFQSKYFEL